MLQFEASAACIAEKNTKRKCETEHIIQMIAVSKKVAEERRRRRIEGKPTRKDTQPVAF